MELFHTKLSDGRLRIWGGSCAAPEVEVESAAAVSALVTVLTMWRSWNSTIPSGAPKSDSGRMRRSAPLMVILGSLGCSTITTASMSGMLMHVSSPKHLQKTSASNQNNAGVSSAPPQGRNFSAAD